MQYILTDPVTALGPIAKKVQKPLKILGINTIRDLLFYYPWRHEDLLQQLRLIGDIKDGDKVSVRAKIELVKNARTRGRGLMIAEARIVDRSGSLRAVWFNQPFIGKILKPGEEYYFVGKVSGGRFGLELSNPLFERVKTEQVHTARIVPMYALSGSLTQKQLRFLIHRSLSAIKELDDYLPEFIKRRYQLLPYQSAIREIHFPTSQHLLSAARRRLSFDELFIIQLSNLKLRRELRQEKAVPVVFDQVATVKFIEQLPFTLTQGQKIAGWEIIKDLAKPYPMNRLLNGDVGSGKTVVAMIAALNVIRHKGQVAVLAPTEILAWQHFNTISKVFHGTAVTTALLTSKKMMINRASLSLEVKEIKRKELLTLLKEGSIDLIVGTHALLPADVNFHRLILVVVDEQHRFGVEQRRALREKSRHYHPHLLSMTATPIPRTLTLSLYGDLDISLLREMPTGRLFPKTFVVKSAWRARAYARIIEEIKKGRQVYVICPLIDPSDDLGVKSVKSEYDYLAKEIFSQFRLGLLHGKMPLKEKEAVMEAFRLGQLDVFISTTVIEVGIDVPNATVMMIEGAERFGLATLHQLRGRVGRGSDQAYCFLFPTSSEADMARLSIFEKSTDGFSLAEKDLELRGQGDIFGTRQSGEVELKIASLTDIGLVTMARTAALMLLQKDQKMRSFPHLAKYLATEQAKVHLE